MCGFVRGWYNIRDLWFWWVGLPTLDDVACWYMLWVFDLDCELRVLGGDCLVG